MVVREIAPLWFIVCAAPAYLAAHGSPRQPADLARHNCLRMRSPTAGRGLNWLLGAERAMTVVDGDLIANDMTALVMAALHGQGLVFAPLPLVLPLLRAGALTPLMPDWLGHGVQVFMHYPSRRNLPARVKSFVNFMLKQLRSNPDLATEPRALIRGLD